MEQKPRSVRIFLASSAELAAHRDAFDLQVRQLNDRWLKRGLHLEPVRWENFLDAMDRERLQSSYNRAITGCDLFVMLFRTKVGKFTAEEFEKAFGVFQDTGRPLIYTYFNNASVALGDIDEDDFLSLKGFQKKLKSLGHFQTVYKDEDGLLRHFTEQLEKLFDAGAFAPADRGSGAPAPAEGTPAKPADLHPYLTRRAAHWRGREAGELDRRFVNLTLMLDRGLDFDGPRHEAQGQFDRLNDLLEAHPTVGAWVLVGLPGSGKSTILQHHEMRSADAALQALAAAGGAGAATAEGAAPTKPEVCIWHRLSEHSADSAAPAQWLTQPDRWPQGLPPLDALRRVARVRFLLDGLNEIKAPDRAQQLQAVDRWTEWAAAEAARGDGLAPIFSVRTLDQSPMSASGFEVRQIVLAPWEAPQIEAYCERKLGPGNALWPTIEGDAQLLALSALPFNLWAQCELFRGLGRAARDRAELMGGLFWQMLCRRVNDGPLKVPGLLGEADRQRIANGEWKRKLRVLPEREGCLVPWLDETLQRLHRQGRQVSVTADQLMAGLQAKPGWATPAQWLAAVRSLQLIDEGGGAAATDDEYTAETLLRCTHQLWQEFFAARGIRTWAASQPERLPDVAPPAMPGLDDTLARLGVQEPLPGPDPTHWEEPVKMAVQLVPDPSAWIGVLQARNLALAGRAALGCSERLPADVLDPLRDALLARSRDPAVDVRQRIEAGLVLGDLGDPRYETREGPHGRFRWPKHWVTVAAGRYRIGDDHAPYENQKPETDVDLQPFAIAFAPVTNAEYRCFIEAGGYQDERWWVGETAKRWLKEGVRNDAEIARIGGLLKRAREDIDGLLEANPQLPESQREWWRERAGETEDQHRELLDEWYGARRYALPQEWQNPVFNSPSQPVMGICQFEAMAYARWLAAQSGAAIRLPTEAEWEAAARGTERRPWPWGQPGPERWQINADAAHLRRTSPVGVFSEGDTPEGLVDMAGNAWEWTTSAFTKNGLNADALTHVAADGLARRVVRGGSWLGPTVGCRPSFRSGFSPDDRYGGLGFRLVVSCPIQRPEP